MPYLSKLLEKPLLEDQVEMMGRELVKNILKVCQPLEIILFGSTAAGNMFPSSDLDVCIIFASKNESEIAKKLILCSPPLIPGQAINYLFYDRLKYEERVQSGGVCEIIAREGRVLYRGNGE